MTESRHQLSRFTAIFAGGTLISRVSGLVRDMAMSALVETGPLAMFNMAFRIPNMLRDLVGEGASNAAFIPVLSHTLEKEGQDAFKEATSAIFSALIVLLGAITLLGVAFMPFIFHLLEPVGFITGTQGFSPSELTLLESLTRWTFPYIFFIALTVFQMGPLFIMKRYAIPSWSPALLNFAQILACLLLFFGPGLFGNAAYALVAGVWLGGVAQLLVQYWAVGKHVGVWRPNFHLRHPAIRTSLALLGPVLLGQSAGEVNKMVDMLFAGSLGKEVVNAFYFSNRLIQLPLAVFGIAIGVAILPSISRAFARNDIEDVRGTLIHGFRQSYYLICPAVAVLIVFPRPIIALLFQRGHFLAEHTEITAVATQYFALGLLCFAWVKVAVSGFYGAQDSKTPVKIAFVSMILNIILIFALSRPLGYRGMALATTISYTVNFLCLYVLLCRRHGRLWDAAFLSALARITATSVAMGFVLPFVHQALAAHFPETNLVSRLLTVAIGLAAAGITYALLCELLGIRDLRAFLSVLSRRR